MTTKYSLEEKENIYSEWFEEDNILKRPLIGLERYNSPVDDEIIDNRKLIFEILKLEGDDLIRLAIARHQNCTCDSFLADKEDMINLRNLLNKIYPD